MTMLATAPRDLVDKALADIAKALPDAPSYDAAIYAVAVGWRDTGRARGWSEAAQVAAFAFVTEVGAALAAAALTR